MALDMLPPEYSTVKGMGVVDSVVAITSTTISLSWYVGGGACGSLVASESEAVGQPVSINSIAIENSDNMILKRMIPSNLTFIVGVSP